MNRAVQEMEEAMGENNRSPVDGATPSAVADFLERYNRWRRNDGDMAEPEPMPDPRDIGRAIDAAVAMLRAKPVHVEHRPPRVEGEWIAAQLDQCAAELPEGYVVRLCAHRAEHWVELKQPSGTLRYFDNSDERSPRRSLPGLLGDALAAAKRHSEGRSDG